MNLLLFGLLSFVDAVFALSCLTGIVSARNRILTWGQQEFII